MPRWPGQEPKYPDTKTAVMLGLCRRELNLTAEAAALACGRSHEMITSVECGIHRLADEPCRKLILFYMDKLGSPAQEPLLPIPQLVENLARALLMSRVKRATELLASAGSGASAIVTAVCEDGLRGGGFRAWKVIRRFRYRLAADDRKRVAEAEIPA